MLKINGNPIPGTTEFAYDGCHKIYLLFTPEDREEYSSLGYDIYPISELPRIWEEDSCGLRYVSPADLNQPNYVNQFQNARVVFCRGGEMPPF